MSSQEKAKEGATQSNMVTAAQAGADQTVESTPNRRMRFPAAVAVLVAVNLLVFLTLPVVFGSQYPTRLDRLGADWGPLTLSGQWWRLLTSTFVHIQLSHLVFNMLGLWLLGKRVEGLLGSGIFLLLYFVCAFIGDMTVLAFHPEGASYGASVGVMGVAGAIIAAYGSRWGQLSWSTRGKLAVLILYVAYVVRSEFSRGLYVGHTAGLLAGTCLAAFFIYCATSARSRYCTFAVILVLLAITGATIRQHYHFAR